MKKNKYANDERVKRNIEDYKNGNVIPELYYENNNGKKIKLNNKKNSKKKRKKISKNDDIKTAMFFTNILFIIFLCAILCVLLRYFK